MNRILSLYVLTESRIMKRLSLVMLLGLFFSISCQSDGEKQSSEPINEQEAILYKDKLITCVKGGGSRIVKIAGHLKCY